VQFPVPPYQNRPKKQNAKQIRYRNSIYVLGPHLNVYEEQ
jgi:hypothetical protein